MKRPPNDSKTRKSHNRSNTGNSGKRTKDELSPTDKAIVSTIICKGFTQEGMKFAERVGKKIGDKGTGVTTSQIRNAYGELTRLRMKENVQKGEILRLKPKLAYSAGRNRTSKRKDSYFYLKNIIDHAVDITCEDGISKEDINIRFQNLALLFEAILAYHKAYGGD